MMKQPDQRVVTEHPDENMTTSEAKPQGGISTADIAGRGTSQKPEDQPASAARDAGPSTAEVEAPARPEAAPLFPAGDAESFRARWNEIQTGFVDDPRHAVEQGDGLVAEVMKRLAETFADERAKLEQQWQKGEDVSTEELRMGLRRYRSFFDRLLSV